MPNPTVESTLRTLDPMEIGSTNLVLGWIENSAFGEVLPGA